MDEPLIISGKRDSRLRAARRCPFCNSEFLVFQSGPESKIWHRPTWRITCIACSTKGPVAGSHKQAVKHWNGVPMFGNPLTPRDQTTAQPAAPHQTRSAQGSEPLPPPPSDRRRIPRQKGT